MMLDWLAAHWVLLLIVSIVWIILAVFGMIFADAQQDGLVAIFALVLVFASWIPIVAFFVGVVVAIIQHFR